MRYHFRSGFTLIELLVVIAIIAILTVVVVLTLNPAAMLQQGRDANRLSDMDTLARALNLFQADQAVVSGSRSLGTSTVIYVSLPDPVATTTTGSNCATLGLPLLPAGYSYHCAGPNFYRRTDGTGWIPVNFSTVTTGSPLGQLPADPTNALSSRLYYAYTTNGSQYEVMAPMESTKYQASESSNYAISGSQGLIPFVTTCPSITQGANTIEFCTNTALTSWTAPAGVTSTTVECVAGGGGGAYGNVQAGGGGGEYRKISVSVAPNAPVPIQVGAGGGGGTLGNHNGSHGASSVWNTNILICLGGVGGGSGGQGGTGGTGGTGNHGGQGSTYSSGNGGSGGGGAGGPNGIGAGSGGSQSGSSGGAGGGGNGGGGAGQGTSGLGTNGGNGGNNSSSLGGGIGDTGSGVESGK